MGRACSPTGSGHGRVGDVTFLAEADIERVLVITAHPDDLDFGASGTIASWTSKGVEVSYCICTDGDAGGFDPDVPRHEIPGIRRAEQIAAGKVLGVEEGNIHFLGYKDGALTPSLELRRDISRVIRQVRPQLVLTQSPDRNYNRIYASHPDHLAAGEAALCAVYPDARNPFAFPELKVEGWDEWTVHETWIMAGNDSNHFVDITDFVDKKLGALRAHVSQTEHISHQIEANVREWNGNIARSHGLPEGRIAEQFLRVDTL